jgi:hypothetical protein
MVDIAGKDWSFVVVHGRQFWDGEEFKSLVDPDGREIRITDTVPLGEQLELAAGAALAIFREGAGLVPLLRTDGLSPDPLPGASGPRL